MQITLDTKPFAALEPDALVTYIFEESDPIQGRIAELDKLSGGLLARLSKERRTDREKSGIYARSCSGWIEGRATSAGRAQGSANNLTPATLRKVAGAALRYLKSRRCHKVAFLLRENDLTDEAAQAITEGAIAADFETDKYKTEKKNEKFIETFTIAGFSDARKGRGGKGNCPRPNHRLMHRTLRRDLVNEPSNKLTPQILADKAEAMAKEAGLKVEILDEKKIAELKMGALLSVAQGSAEPPAHDRHHLHAGKS